MQLLSELMLPHILSDKCVYASTGPRAEMEDSAGVGRKILSEEARIKLGKRLKHPPVRPPLDCVVSIIMCMPTSTLCVFPARSLD